MLESKISPILSFLSSDGTAPLVCSDILYVRWMLIWTQLQILGGNYHKRRSASDKSF